MPIFEFPFSSFRLSHLPSTFPPSDFLDSIFDCRFSIFDLSVSVFPTPDTRASPLDFPASSFEFRFSRCDLQVGSMRSDTNILLRAPYPPQSTCSKEIIKILLPHAVIVKE